MFKKNLSLTLVLALMASFSLPYGAFALNYSGGQRNPATFETWYNQALPLKKVVVAKDANPDAAKYIRDAYYNMFIKAMRAPILKPGLYSASTPYQNNSLDQAPYSLCERNAIIDGVTQNGIQLVHQQRRWCSYDCLKRY